MRVVGVAMRVVGAVDGWVSSSACVARRSMQGLGLIKAKKLSQTQRTTFSQSGTVLSLCYRRLPVEDTDNGGSSSDGADWLWIRNKTGSRLARQ